MRLDKQFGRDCYGAVEKVLGERDPIEIRWSDKQAWMVAYVRKTASKA